MPPSGSASLPEPIARPIALSALAASVPGATVIGEASTLVRGVFQDSRKVTSGSVFAVRSGAKSEGRRFVQDAIGRGAIALLVDDASLASDSGLPAIVVPNVRASLGPIAMASYGLGPDALTVIGLTGTNGKTTTSYLTQAILTGAGLRTATLGTLGCSFEGIDVPGTFTTPEADDLARTIRTLVDLGATHLVMEVSSHALAQYRADGLKFAIAGFTNLTQDHLDFHGTLDAYGEAKSRLFTGTSHGAPFIAVINVDDPFGAQLAKRAASTCRFVLTVSPSGRDADLRVTSSSWTMAGLRSTLALPTRFPLPSANPPPVTSASLGVSSEARRSISNTQLEPLDHEPRPGTPSPPRLFAPSPSSATERERGTGGEVALASPLVGAHNLENLCVSLGIAYGLGIDMGLAATTLASSPAVPGRLERCSTAADDVLVVVDYAHTPDALVRVLAALRPLTDGELWCVFGCGGDRDPGKRPQMGAAVASGADRIVVTNDNPRSEHPEDIARAIEPGLHPSGKRYEVELDRAKAIELAISSARPGDVVLVAGKGHEPYQIVGAEVRAFDDRVESRQALARRRARPAHAGSAEAPNHAASANDAGRKRNVGGVSHASRTSGTDRGEN